MKALYIGGEGEVYKPADLAMRLRWPDAAVLHSRTAHEGLELIEREAPDVVLLYPDFHDLSLREVIREMRFFTEVPLLVLGRVGNEMEAVTALETGADDYVRLPCDLTEIMARVWAVIRRSDRMVSVQEGPLRSGELLLNPATYETFIGTRRVHLTTRQFRMLHLLLRNKRGVVSHEALRQVCSPHGEGDGSIKKYIQLLRRELGDNAREPRWIASVHGVGYRFIGPPPPA